MAIKLIKKPAENNMYTCHDTHAGYGLPFSCANDSLALQAFKFYCLTDPEGQMNAPYLELYRCGTFNRDTGEYKNNKFKLIGKGTKYVSNSIQRTNQDESADGQ